MTRIKVCGITNLADARAAVDAGADALGFILAESKRRIAPEAARKIIEYLPPLTTTVGVFMNQPIEIVMDTARLLGVHAVQLHGDESPADVLSVPRQVIKRFKISEGVDPGKIRADMQRYRAAAYMLDPGAGEGLTFDWSLACDLPGPLITAGGLTPENVGAAIRTARPYAVDVCSGVEAEPGRKDYQRMQAFIEQVRIADDENE